VLACIAPGGCSSAGQPGLEVADTALPSGYVGRAYVASIAVVPPAPSEVRWSLSAGTLPPGLVFGDLSGPSVNVQGTPASGGDFAFTIAAESGARRAERALTLHVDNMIALVGDLPRGSEGAPYQGALRVEGGVGETFVWDVQGATASQLAAAPSGRTVSI